MVHVYNGILSSHKKNELKPSVATEMDLEIIMLSELSHTEKDECIISLICETLKNETDEPIYKIEIDSQTWKTNLWLPKGK